MIGSKPLIFTYYFSATTDYTSKSVTVSGWGTNEGYRWHAINPARAAQCKLQGTTLKVILLSHWFPNFPLGHGPL